MFDRRLLIPLLALALLPATLYADDALDDLDVTMEVLDSESELDVLVSQMRGPARSDASRDLGDETSPVVRDPGPFGDSTAADGFDRDSRPEEEELLREDDFESDEGEDLELDELSDEPYPSDDY